MKRLIMSRLVRIYTVRRPFIDLLILDWIPYLQEWMWPNLAMEESVSELLKVIAALHTRLQGT